MNFGKDIPKNILEKNAVVYFLILTVTFLSRIIFAEKYFYDGDTVGVALGTISYSLQFTRPHLPGYYLHVKIISLLNYFIGDLHLSMVLLSTIYSSLAAALTYKLLRKWFESDNSLLIIALVIFNPMVWFYGSTPEVYSFDLLISVLLVLLLINKKGIYFTPLLLGFAIGVRQTSGILLLPVYLYLWIQFYKSNKISATKILFAHIVGLIAFLSWFIPMINTAGGLSEYIELFKSNSPLPNISLLQNIFQFSSYGFYVFTPFIILILFTGRFKKFKINFHSESKQLLIIFLLWLLPALLTFILFTYHKGYFLISIIPLYGIVGILLNKNLISKWLLISIVILEIFFFTLMPFKELPVQSITAPVKRSQNIFNTWIDRTLSSYLMSASRIKYQDEVIEELSTIVEKLEYEKIFLDPTLYLSARGLQFKFPRTTFITMNYFNANYYIEYKGLDVTEKKGLSEELINSYLLTRNDFYDSDQKIFGVRFAKSKNYSIVFINQQSQTRIFEFYQKQFLR